MQNVAEKTHYILAPDVGHHGYEGGKMPIMGKPVSFVNVMCLGPMNENFYVLVYYTIQVDGVVK